MKRYLFFLLALCSLVSCAAQKTSSASSAAQKPAAGKTEQAAPIAPVQEAPDSVMYLTTGEFLQKVCDLRSAEWKYLGDKPCIIDFYTTWCGPCKRLAPIMQTLAKKYKGKIYFYKVDTERERELAYAFNISSIPQVLYVPMTGKPTITKGLLPEEQIEDLIQKIIKP